MIRNANRSVIEYTLRMRIGTRTNRDGRTDGQTGAHEDGQSSL